MCSVTEVCKWSWSAKPEGLRLIWLKNMIEMSRNEKHYQVPVGSWVVSHKVRGIVLFGERCGTNYIKEWIFQKCISKTHVHVAVECAMNQVRIFVIVWVIQIANFNKKSIKYSEASGDKFKKTLNGFFHERFSYSFGYAVQQIKRYWTYFNY